jgi:PPK2 family polyphosphate:nucleotide phosphotransferase
MRGDLLSRFQASTNGRFRLRDHDPAWDGGAQTKEHAASQVDRNHQRLYESQELLWASGTHSVLIVLQAMDTAGKDGLIKHVMTGLNPQGCDVWGFKVPSAREQQHDFLWRYSMALPARGSFGIFNRSYYEEVLVVRVHPEFLAKQGSADHHSLWTERYEEINDFEKHLARNGTAIVKFFLHLSKKEQRKRLLERLNEPAKHWKFSAADLAERQYWPEYMTAYEDAIAATSTKHAPWYILPADHKWVARWLASEILIATVKQLKLKLPPVSKQQRAAITAAKRELGK